MRHVSFRRRFRRPLLALAAIVAVAATMPVPSVVAQEDDNGDAGLVGGRAGEPPRPVNGGPRLDAPGFTEVGRVRVPPLPESPPSPDSDYRQASGWLMISPGSRRGYQLVELGPSFVIQSFDLDTLEVRRQAVVAGAPMPNGLGAEAAQNTTDEGDVVHAVDPVAKRIYLAVSISYVLNGLNTNPDNNRALAYVLVIDEEKFDRDPASAFGSFSLAPAEQRLQAYSLVGMQVTRKHVAADRPGKLLGVFASVYPMAAVPLLGTPIPGPYDHTLVQWDAGTVPTAGPAPAFEVAPGTLPLVSDWQEVLLPCATAPLTSLTDRDSNVLNAKTLQWGILATSHALFTGCQSAPNSGAIVRVAVDSTGRPVSGGQQVFPLARTTGDLLVDEAGQRLFMRSYGGGHTWWVFDAPALRFVGSIVGAPADPIPNTAGVDPGSGRFYTLGPDMCIIRSGGGYQSLRGGLTISDARLAPVPAQQLVVPGLQRPSTFGIKVDPVTRRVFVRRGNGNQTRSDPYPHCDPTGSPKGKAPMELFWRVYEDRIPVASQPGELDDAPLTADVAEAVGLTEASYLGSGAGFGARSLLIGGADALATGAPTSAGSLCGRDDREALVGSVGKVEMSNQTTLAEAAALDADARTQEALGDPLSRCRPQAPPQPVGPRNMDELNRCHGDVDVREGSFDQPRAGAPDANQDGCTDRDGRNRYAARCLGTRDEKSPGFDDDEVKPGRVPSHVAPRAGFEASATCDEKAERAGASAVGASVAAELLGGPVRVARASSDVSVVRKAGKGVTVKVDSIARGVEIPGIGTIGVVRSEAVSTSTGRRGGATTSFTRTICDVDIQGLIVSGCLGDDKQQQFMARRINDALGGRGEVRLRTPDASMARGTAHGYLAGIQRDRLELFGDQAITRDYSLAVPALEIVLYQGDGGEWGAGRQVTQLAGVQASTSYGVTCTYGKRADGKCAAEDEESVSSPDLGDLLPGPDDPIVTTIVEQLPGDSIAAAPVFGTPRESVLTRVLRALPRAVAEALRLLFNNPRELGLLAALWALLYAPCYLGDRRRAVRRIAARRLSSA